MKSGILVAAVLVAMATGTAQARDLRLASCAPPVHPATDPMHSSFMKFLPELIKP